MFSSTFKIIAFKFKNFAVINIVLYTLFEKTMFLTARYLKMCVVVLYLTEFNISVLNISDVIILKTEPVAARPVDRFSNEIRTSRIISKKCNHRYFIAQDFGANF